MSVVSTLHAAAVEETEGVEQLAAGVLERAREYRLERVRQELPALKHRKL